jgi:hypothetical protein
LWQTKVILTKSPQNIDAITATKDFDMLVKSKKEIITDKKSVIKKFFNNKLLIKFGKCRKENTKLSQVKNPNNSPSYIMLLV